MFDLFCARQIPPLLRSPTSQLQLVDGFPDGRRVTQPLSPPTLRRLLFHHCFNTCGCCPHSRRSFIATRFIPLSSGIILCYLVDITFLFTTYRPSCYHFMFLTCFASHLMSDFCFFIASTSLRAYMAFCTYLILTSLSGGGQIYGIDMPVSGGPRPERL